MISRSFSATRAVMSAFIRKSEKLSAPSSKLMVLLSPGHIGSPGPLTEDLTILVDLLFQIRNARVVLCNHVVQQGDLVGEHIDLCLGIVDLTIELVLLCQILVLFTLGCVDLRLDLFCCSSSSSYWLFRSSICAWSSELTVVSA